MVPYTWLHLFWETIFPTWTVCPKYLSLLCVVILVISTGLQEVNMAERKPTLLCMSGKFSLEEKEDFPSSNILIKISLQLYSLGANSFPLNMFWFFLWRNEGSIILTWDAMTMSISAIIMSTVEDKTKKEGLRHRVVSSWNIPGLEKRAGCLWAQGLHCFCGGIWPFLFVSLDWERYSVCMYQWVLWFPT